MNMDPGNTHAELVRRVKEAGVAGAGGAGFPTWRKLDCKGRVDTVILNGAECEPLLFSDLHCMRSYPEAIVGAAVRVREALGAREVVIAFKHKRRKHLGGLVAAAAGDPAMRVLELEDVYPSGDEHVLTFLATGRVPPQSGLPLDVGVLIQNVQTAVHIHEAMEGRPVTRRFVTVAGAVGRPFCAEAPLGTRVEDLLERAGGVTCPDPLVLAGGVMMGRPVEAGEGVARTTSGIVVLPPDNPVAKELRTPLEREVRVSASVCDQCYTCTELCPRHLLGHAIEPHKLMRRAGRVLSTPGEEDHIAFYCCECGVCSLVACPVRITPRRLIAAMKSVVPREFVRKAAGVPHPDHARKALPMPWLKMRLAIERFDVEPEFLGPLNDVPRLSLDLREFGGSRAQPRVEPGDLVLAGDRVAEGRWLDVHAPLAGTVESVGGSVDIRVH